MAGDFIDAPIIIDSNHDLQALVIQTKSRAMHPKFGKLGLIIVDGLHLIDSFFASQIAHDETAVLLATLKKLANELSCPLIITANISKWLESRPNKRPILKDLLTGGLIEEFADLILFVYRDEVYNPESEDAGTVEIIIGKQRNGPLGAVRLRYLCENSLFTNQESID